MEILAVVPARGGSKGIPGKNIHPLNGSPLISYTIDAIKGSKYITRAVLSSDSPEIIETAEKLKLEVPYKRPPELALDDTPAIPVIQHVVNFLEQQESYRPDYIILLQPTSPLRTSKHIDEALECLINSAADSVVSVVKAPHNFNPYSVMELKDAYLTPFLKYDETKNLRQKKPVFYGRNGAAIYAFTYECLMQKNSLYGDSILAYEMNSEDSFDIDETFDLEICEWLLQRRLKKEELL